MKPLKMSLSALVIAVVISALAVINTKHMNRSHFIELQKLLNTRDAIEVEWGQLQLEQATWATHGRIEQLARERLNMTLPRKQTLVVVAP